MLWHGSEAEQRAEQQRPELVPLLARSDTDGEGATMFEPRPGIAAAQRAARPALRVRPMRMLCLGNFEVPTQGVADHPEVVS